MSADGALTPKSPATVVAGPNPFAIAVGPPAPVPATKDQCKNGGWRDFGPGFKNQGQCVSFLATGGKKQP